MLAVIFVVFIYRTCHEEQHSCAKSLKSVKSKKPPTEFYGYIGWIRYINNNLLHPAGYIIDGTVKEALAPDWKASVKKW